MRATDSFVNNELHDVLSIDYLTLVHSKSLLLSMHGQYLLFVVVRTGSKLHMSLISLSLLLIIESCLTLDFDINSSIKMRYLWYAH